jgi:hypothetical protein
VSVLDAPRVYFRGQMTWDPMVTNNYQSFYNLATSKPVLGAGTVADYREKARQSATRGNWNPHGTHRSTFFETTVCGVDCGGGLRTDDALVGAPVSFTGMLVDLNPYGATTSQLFFDQLGCGIQGGSQILARRETSMVARRLNFARNTGYTVIAGVASVVWQTSFSFPDSLSVEPRGSQALEALYDALSEEDTLGLTVRMNTYRTVYYGTEAPTAEDGAQLAAQIANGGFHPNPARSMVVGVIGPWREGEPPSAPADRVLAATEDSAVSTAFAKVAGRRLTIDLANSVPETGFDLTKTDLGPLDVVAKAPSGDVALGTLPYSAYAATAYAATSGLVDLDLDDEQAAAALDSDLEVHDGQGVVLLTEQRLTVVAERPNIYLEEGESTTVLLRAFERGRPPVSPVSITMAEMGGPLPPVQVVTDADGNVTVPVQGGKSGSWAWVLVPWRGQPPTPPANLVPTLNEYLVLRTTPVDDHIARMEPTWTNVYEQVLRDWEALAPCMDNWLRLGDEQQVTRYASLIRQLTSRDRFEHFRYMPVTRELTKGQRTLLHKWCDAVLGTTTPEALVATEAAGEPSAFGRGF